MISDHHQRVIAEELHRLGLTFKPLQTEMLDHICCDVEARMKEGSSFDDALRITLNDIDPDHFQRIQKETVDAIQNRINTTRWVSYAGLFCLYASLCFKALHLQYGGFLLAIGFGCFVVALVLPAVVGIKFNREKPGAIRVLAIVIGIAALLVGYTLRILSIPGGDSIVLLSVAITTVTLIANTMYVYRNATASGNLLSFLHEKYASGIERFLLILLVPAGIYKVLSAMLNASVFYGDLALLIVIFGAGIHLLALYWRMLEEKPAFRSPAVLSGILISIGVFLPVFAGEFIPMQIRIVMIIVYSMVSAWLVFQIREKDWLSTSIVVVVPAWFLFWAMMRLDILPQDFSRYLFSVPVLLLMVVITYFTSKHSALRTYLILSLGGCLFELLRTNP